MEISGGKAEFQYLRRKLLASSAHLIEAACVLGQIRYISSVFLCPFGLFPSPFPQAIFLDKSRAVPVHGGAAPWQQDLSHLLTGCKKQHSGCEVIWGRGKKKKNLGRAASFGHRFGFSVIKWCSPCGLSVRIRSEMLKTVACWCKEGIWKELEKKGLAFGGCVKPSGPFKSELVRIVFGGSRWGCTCLRAAARRLHWWWIQWITTGACGAVPGPRQVVVEEIWWWCDVPNEAQNHNLITLCVVPFGLLVS